MRPIIALLTDFGLSDPFVGVMKGVIAQVNPDAVVIDLTHEVPKYGIDVAAYILKSTYRYFPKRTIFTVVVDPGVGSARKPLILQSRNYFFIGPDNGVLIPAAKDDGLLRAYEIRVEVAGLPKISWTFHGRDIFAPTAALLSLGINPESIGKEISINDLKTIEIPPKKPVEVAESTVRVDVFYVDSFGNLVLTTDMGTLAEVLGVGLGDYVKVSTSLEDQVWYIAKVVRTFSEVKPGELALYEGSLGLAEIAVYLSSASKLLNVGAGGKIYLRRK